MYLPLAAVVAAVVLGAYGLLQRSERFRATPAALRREVCVGLVAMAAAGLGVTTFARNTVYRDEVAFWSDVASLLARQRRYGEAMEHYRTALRLKPDFPQAAESLHRLEQMSNR